MCEYLFSIDLKKLPYHLKKCCSGRNIAETRYKGIFLLWIADIKLFQNSYFMKMTIAGLTILRKVDALRGVSAGR